MSQIGSWDGAPGLESAGAGRLRPEIFMSAMLTYFGFIVTQSSALTKGSYRTAGSRWSTLNRLGKRALMFRPATYREMGHDAKAASRRKFRQELRASSDSCPTRCFLEECHGGAI